MNCPLCSQALEGGELVMVCHPCHKSLGGGLDVNATGEFRVPTTQELQDHMETTSGQRPHTTNVCSWCGKLEAQVKKLLGRGGTALCDECVSLASDIMEAELGPNWR
ncbi:MAG TPA: ClpX C4-type zinc finger protein [Kofleriaceae bacterium]